MTSALAGQGSTVPTEAGDNRPHAVIIGAGFGGLAAAIRLGVRGYRVTVLDRLDCAGGRARVFKSDGFTFDAGPTVITAPFLLEELWELCGKSMHDEIDLRPVSPFYRIRFHDGEDFDYTGSPDQMEREVRRLAPDDVQGYKEFIRACERIFEIGFQQLSDVPFNSFWDMAKIVPAMVRLESYRSVFSLVSKYVRHPRLRQILSFHPLLVGGNPFNTTSIYALIAFLERKWGVHFPMGGTGAVVDGLVGLIEHDIQGRVVLGQQVSEIVVRDGRAAGVRLSSGETIEADIVVSNADAAWTYKYLVPNHARPSWTDRRIERSRYSMGLFVWYFGTNRKYPDVAHHTILLGPRYKGLLRDIFEEKTLADDFSLYLHRPTATDPSLAPTGHDGFYVLSPVPNLEADIDWTIQAERYKERIAQFLNASILPGLQHSVVTSRIMTPLDFQTDYLSYRGAGFSLEPVLTQSAFFRPHNVSEDIDGLYLVGAGTHPGAGVPGVLSSAKVLDRVVPLAHANR